MKKLTFSGICAVNRNVRSSLDNRRKVDQYIVAYMDYRGYEYRKSFEFPIGKPHPILPESGTSEELTALKYQWKEPTITFLSPICQN